MAKLKTLRFGSESVDVEVNGEGWFEAQLSEASQDVIRAKTLAELEEQVAATMKKRASKAPVEVSVIDIEKKTQQWGGGDYSRGRGTIDITLRGVTERTRDLLVTFPDGKKGKLEIHPFGETIVRRLTPADQALYTELQTQLIQALQAVETFRQERLFNWREYFETR